MDAPGIEKPAIIQAMEREIADLKRLIDSMQTRITTLENVIQAYFGHDNNG